MSFDNSADYVNPDAVYDFLKIISTNTSALKIANDAITDANQQIETDLIPFAESLPLTGVLLGQAREAGFNYAVSRYKQMINNLEGQKSFMLSYEKKRDSMITALKASYNTRNRIVAVSLDYDTEDPIFSQRIY